MSGWIKIHRNLVDNPFWKAEKFTYGQAWVDLILTANFKDGSFMKSGQIVKVKRGQCALSFASYQKRWGWSKGRVQRFFYNLEAERMISTQANHLTTIVTICNYNEYQGASETNEPAERPPNGSSVEPPDGSSVGSRYKNVKKEKNDKEEKNIGSSDDKPDPALESVKRIYAYWHTRMSKDGKTKMTEGRKRAIKARLKTFSEEDIITAIEGCAARPWNMGDNPDGKTFNDLTLICRNDEKIDFYREAAHTMMRSNPQMSQQMNRNWQNIKDLELD